MVTETAPGTTPLLEFTRDAVLSSAATGTASADPVQDDAVLSDFHRLLLVELKNGGILPVEQIERAILSVQRRFESLLCTALIHDVVAHETTLSTVSSFPPLLGELGWTREQVDDVRNRLAAFESEWDAPGMDDYDAL